jgi:antitoxin component of MazEF toxin-antitoxin module
MKSEAYTKSKPGKLLKVGNSILLTLPPEFIKKNKLKPGDKVGITYDSILVIVHPGMQKEEMDAGV